MRRFHFLWIFIVVGMLAVAIAEDAFCFNLIHDIQDQTTFPVGQSASAGTAVNLRNGTLSASALAEIINYRMLSGWYGGTFVNSGDKNMTDTAKIGLNLGYFMTGFAHKPPAILTNLVIGPSFAMSLISTPRVGTPFFDVNYRFGGGSVPPAPTPPSASAPAMPIPAPPPVNP